MMAGSDTGKGFANSLTVTVSRWLSAASKARRVGSANAPNVRSRGSGLNLTIWLSV